MEQLIPALQNFLSSVTPLTDEASQALNLFVFFVQWAATILSALAGFFAARKHGMAVYGSLVIGFVVSLGGGTIRDVLLGRYPIFWVANPVYAVTVVVVALSMLFVKQETGDRKTIAAKVARPVVRLAHEESKWFITIDSLALGLWAYLGTTYALQLGTPPVIAPIMGIVTASFGGVLRDLFFARVPQEFLPGQLYSTAAAAGAVVYVLLWQLGLGGTIGFLACFALTFLIRVASVRLNIETH